MMKGLRVCTNRGKFSQNNLISNKGKKKKREKRSMENKELLVGKF